jgi:hypothetical protein
MEYYSIFKKKKILSLVTTWINLENIVLCEISQPQEDKYHMTYMWNLKMLNLKKQKLE